MLLWSGHAHCWNIFYLQWKFNQSRLSKMLSSTLSRHAVVLIYDVFSFELRWLRGNIIRTAPCWVVWHNVYSQQHTRMSSSYRSSRLGLSHWDPYAMHRGGCLELYYCNMVEWSWWVSSFIWKTNWFPSVLQHCWFGHMTCKNRCCWTRTGCVICT